jgi:hypothetical protein
VCSVLLTSDNKGKASNRAKAKPVNKANRVKVAKGKAASKAKAKPGVVPAKVAKSKKAKVLLANKEVKENPRESKKASQDKAADQTRAKIPILKSRKVPVATRLLPAETTKAPTSRKVNKKVTRNLPREKVAVKTKTASNKAIPTAKGATNPKAKVASKEKFRPKVLTMVQPSSG